MLLVPLVACYIGNFRLLFFRSGEHLGFVEQEAQLLHARFVRLFRGRAKPLVLARRSASVSSAIWLSRREIRSS